MFASTSKTRARVVVARVRDAVLDLVDDVVEKSTMSNTAEASPITRITPKSFEFA